MTNATQFCRSCGTRLNGEAYCPKCQRATGIGTAGAAPRAERRTETPPRVSSTPVAPPPRPSPVARSRGAMGRAVSECFSKYRDFSGRAARSEYWWFVLFVALMNAGFTLLSMLSSEWLIIQGVFQLAVFLPLLAAMIRRLHDTGHGGWWSLLTIAPFFTMGFLGGFALTSGKAISEGGAGMLLLASVAASVWVLILLCLPTQSGSNVHGAEPVAF